MASQRRSFALVCAAFLVALYAVVSVSAIPRKHVAKPTFFDDLAEQGKQTTFNIIEDAVKAGQHIVAGAEDAVSRVGKIGKKFGKVLKKKISPSSKKSKKLHVAQSGEYKVVSHDNFPRYQIRVKESSKLCDPLVKQKFGYLDVDGSKHFFFWFFESRSSPAQDPLILWLNGGPGCSSLTGLFMELGPCRASESGAGNGTLYNPESWNSNANIIFLDQPVNVGFSYSDEEVSNTVDAAKDVYAFLQLFLQEHQKYAPLDFHVTGESYAGHYIPAIASEIIGGNYDLPEPPNPDYPDDPEPEEPEGSIYINLKSIAIGNGLTDPLTQYEYYADFAADKTYGPVLDEATIAGMRTKYSTCASLISACYSYQSAFACVPGAFYCNSAMISPFQQTGLNIYDVRKKCDPDNSLCYNILNDIETYLNRADVQSELGVTTKYVGCNQQVNLRFMFAGDWMRPFHELIPEILSEGVRVLIYAGDADYICNWIGNKAWVLDLEWDYKDEFNNSPDSAWVSKKTGKPAGQFRSYEGLTFLRVYEAGHMVPYDQPEHSNEFINAWISEKAL